MQVQSVLNDIKIRHPGEPEFYQAVNEFLESIVDFYNSNPQFESAGIIERLVEPDRVLMFRVTWLDDEGKVKVNNGYRVQFNNSIGPYKGGLRFHPSVTVSILKFLGFEQIFKNSLTTLPMGGGKGGADFNPKGKSNNEIMRFCQAFMLELWNIIGPETDIPAGDIGVGTREIGYLYGMYKKLTHKHNGVITGKSTNWGGSRIRPEATGYGGIYYIHEMLNTLGESIDGKTIAVSGFGNVAWGAIKKATELGAKVVTLSGPDGYIYDEDGISGEKIDYMLDLRYSNEDIIEPYAKKYGVPFFKGKKPWEVKCDIALPSATENELDIHDSKLLIDNKVLLVAELSNMGCTMEAIKNFQKNKIPFSPGKATNAGGVAVSGLEMSQNAVKYSWSSEGVDDKLKRIMMDIHDTCYKHGLRDDGYVDYVKGANIAGFIKVASAMIDQGIT
ncbi:NADP-specific glutamate dehydrogenase [Bacteroidota bacterium]